MSDDDFRFLEQPDLLQFFPAQFRMMFINIHQTTAASFEHCADAREILRRQHRNHFAENAHVSFDASDVMQQRTSD